MRWTTEPVWFHNSVGQRLAGRLDRPREGRPIAHAIFAHCFTCSKDIKSINRISKALAERGVAVLRFDFTGLGESEGEFSETTFSTNIQDILAAADFLRSRGTPPDILIGHSLGGTAMLAAAPRIGESRLVATIAAPAETRQIRDRLLNDHPEIMAEGVGDVTFGGRPVRIRREFLEDLDTHDITREVAELGRSLFVFHASGDELLDIDHGLRVFAAANSPKSFVCLEGADHLLLQSEQDARYVARIIAAWAKRNVLR